MELIGRALEFEKRKTSYKTTSERIIASREAKELILGLNEVYKKNKDSEIMDLMKGRLEETRQGLRRRLLRMPSGVADWIVENVHFKLRLHFLSS